MEPQLELIPNALNSSIYAFLYENDNFADPWHYHKEYELTLILKSSGIRYMGNSIDDFYPGDLVLVGPSLPHCWKNESGYAEGVRSICIQWHHEVLDKFIEESIEFHDIRILLQHAQYGTRILHTPAQRIKEKLLQLLSMEPAKKMIFFLELLLELSGNKEKVVLSGVGKGLTTDSQGDKRIQGILQFIGENHTRKITIKDMADLTFMTEVSFCKFFKRRFRKSFTNYLNEFRIRKSCQLLRETDKKLIDVAMDCGYENMSFFHRQFKKYLSMTPNEYRLLHK